MIAVLIALPAILLLMSAAYLFIDLKKPKAWIIGLAVFLIQFLVLGVFTHLAIMLDQDQDTLLDKVQKQELAQIEAEIKDQVLINRLAIDPETVGNPLKQAILFGMKPTNAFFQRIDQANTLLNELLEQSKTLRLETGISVYRLPDDINQDLVAQLFRQLGYKAFYTPTPKKEEEEEEEEDEDEDEYDEDEDEYDEDEEGGEDEDEDFEDEDFEDEELEEEQDNTAQTKTEKLNLNYQRKANVEIAAPAQPLASANVLYLGNRVTTKDAKIAALLLIRSGVHLKNIRKFRDATKENARTITLDYNKLYERRATLTPASVAATKRFR